MVKDLILQLRKVKGNLGVYNNMNLYDSSVVYKIENWEKRNMLEEL